MEDKIQPLDAKKLRVAMKAVTDNEDVGTTAIFGDEVHICASPNGSPRGPKQLVIKKDGKTIAAIMVTPSIIKRLRFEMECWKRIHSGGMKAFQFQGKR